MTEKISSQSLRILTAGPLAFLFLSGLLASTLFADETEEESLDELILAGTPADQVLDLMEDLTGRTVLRQAGLPNPALSLSVRDPIPQSEAVVALESLLKLNGIAVIDSGERFLKAVSVDQASRQVPELIVSSTLGRPATERIFAALFIPEYLEADELAELIRPVLSSDTVIELARSSGILVTDSLNNLQRAETLITKMDRPRGLREAVRFFRLEHVDARQVAERLNALKQGPLLPYIGEASSFDADERTNQLVVVTQPANLDLIEEIISNLDGDVKPLTDSAVFYIKHAQADEIVPLIESLITGQRDADTEAGGTPRARRNGERPDDTGEGPPPGLEDLSRELSNGGRRLQFSPYVTLVSDERSNAIVVYGTPSDIEFVRGIIEKIDVLLAQVRIEVVIAEVNLRKGKARGLDVFGIEYNVDGESELRLARDADGQEIPLRAGRLSLSALAVRDFSLRAVFNVAEEDGDVSVLSSPTIVTTHNKEATISVIESRPIVTGTLTDTGGTGLATRSTIQFRDIGIELAVTPLIGNDGVIQMEIEQTVENVVREISGSGNPDLDGQPVIGSRRATSFLTIGDRDVIILGGLQERSRRLSENRLALLGQLPVLGSSIFTRRSMEEENRELMIFIKPYVIESPQAGSLDAREILDRSIHREEIDQFLDTGVIDSGELQRLQYDQREGENE